MVIEPATISRTKLRKSYSRFERQLEGPSAMGGGMTPSTTFTGRELRKGFNGSTVIGVQSEGNCIRSLVDILCQLYSRFYVTGIDTDFIRPKAIGIRLSNPVWIGKF